MAFPAELPGERTLTLVTFVEKQQKQVREWVERMNLDEPGAPPWIELPVLSDLGEGFRGYMDWALKTGVQTPQDRSHVFALYTHVREFCNRVGLPSTRRVYALVIDRRGRILAQEEGNPTPSSIRRLWIALRPSMSERAVA